jgi:DNA-binding HxlR family transcriptional regulator
MLKELLRLAVRDGTQRPSELAKALEITPELATQMLEQLEQQGYLQAVVPGCSVPCEGCPDDALCLIRSNPRVWALTEKGERLLSQEP